MIEFQEDTWIWREYKLLGDNLKTEWLSEEDVDGKVQYSLYKENYRVPTPNSINFSYQNEEYSLFEQGRARVIGYFGNVDVDMSERVNFSEYINESRDKLISIEDWDGEVEKSTGCYLNEADVTVTDEINKVKNENVSSNIKIFAVFGVIIAVFILPIIYALHNDVSMSKFLEKDSNFQYVTSVTNNENNKKAKVYKTDLGIEQATKKIIDGCPETIQKVTEDTDNEEKGVGLFTKSEYAYVYESEDNKTYVQVSKKNYVTSQSNSYRSRYRRSGYYRTYTTNSTNSNYTSYLNSARQQSINSRKSSGGGTSSGK